MVFAKSLQERGTVQLGASSYAILIINISREFRSSGAVGGDTDKSTAEPRQHAVEGRSGMRVAVEEHLKCQPTAPATPPLQQRNGNPRQLWILQILPSRNSYDISRYRYSDAGLPPGDISLKECAVCTKSTAQGKLSHRMDGRPYNRILGCFYIKL